MREELMSTTQPDTRVAARHEGTVESVRVADSGSIASSRTPSACSG